MQSSLARDPATALGRRPRPLGVRVTPSHPLRLAPRAQRLEAPVTFYIPPLTTESPTTHYCTVQHHVPIDPYAERMPRADCSSNTIRDSISRVAPRLCGARASRPPCGTRGVRARLRAAGQPSRAGLVLEEVYYAPPLTTQCPTTHYYAPVLSGSSIRRDRTCDIASDRRSWRGCHVRTSACAPAGASSFRWSAPWRGSAIQPPCCMLPRRLFIVRLPRACSSLQLTMLQRVASPTCAGGRCSGA